MNMLLWNTSYQLIPVSHFHRDLDILLENPENSHKTTSFVNNNLSAVRWASLDQRAPETVNRTTQVQLNTFDYKNASYRPSKITLTVAFLCDACYNPSPCSGIISTAAYNVE